jgi:hypothetical protein
VDETEELVYQHLLSRGHASVLFEPDGNRPPDFLVDKVTAVEARRLNQHDRLSGRPLEEKGIPFFHRLVNLIESQPASHDGVRFIGVSLRRPLPTWAAAESALRRFAQELDAPAPLVGATAAVHNLEFELVHFTPDGPGRFAWGSRLDLDAGGFVLAELRRNLELCVRETSEKTGPHRHRYPVWWLVLVDRITYGLSDREREEFVAGFNFEHDWDKIVIVNPREIGQCIEL